MEKEPITQPVLDYATPARGTSNNTGCVVVLALFLALLTLVAVIWIVIWAIAASGILAPYIGHF
jgi:hypothetical protein